MKVTPMNWTVIRQEETAEGKPWTLRDYRTQKIVGHASTYFLAVEMAERRDNALRSEVGP